MFIAQAYKVKHEFWRYLIGVLIVVAGLTIGQIPLTAAILMEIGAESFSLTESEMMQVLDSNYFFFLLLLSYAVALGFLFLAVKYIHGQSIKLLTTSREKIDWSRIWFAFGIVFIYILLLTLGEYFTNPDYYQYTFELTPFLILLAIAVIFVPLQTSFEEYLFRALSFLELR